MKTYSPITDLSIYPSINQIHGSDRTSSRYTFIPTQRIINILDNQGWKVSSIMEKQSRKDNLRGFGDHLVRFRREQDFGISAVIGEHVPEIVLTGSHDGTSAWEMMFGLFRFVCGNGAMVAEGQYAGHKIRHVGFQDQNVIDAVADVIETAPRILDRVKAWEALPLERAERLALAEASVVAKYGDEGLAKMDIERLAAPTRREDAEPNLWTTYNVLQEKLVERGGRFAVNSNSGRRTRFKQAQGISSVSENVRVNQALWMLADKMAQLKGAVAN